MEIKKESFYKVTKMAATGKDSNLGTLPGEDVKKLLKGYTYDETFGLWYSEKATLAYDVTEA